MLFTSFNNNVDEFDTVSIVMKYILAMYTVDVYVKQYSIFHYRPFIVERDHSVTSLNCAHAQSHMNCHALHTYGMWGPKRMYCVLNHGVFNGPGIHVHLV